MLERKRNLTNNAIDFVITWVNGNETLLQAIKGQKNFKK